MPTIDATGHINFICQGGKMWMVGRTGDEMDIGGADVSKPMQLFGTMDVPGFGLMAFCHDTGTRKTTTRPAVMPARAADRHDQ